MLWHPSSLHQRAEAARRASDLLARNAANRPGVPSDPVVIEAEVAELHDGDVPAFVTTARSGHLAAAYAVRLLCENAIQGEDGTATWAARRDPGHRERLPASAAPGAPRRGDRHGPIFQPEPTRHGR